MKFTIVWFLGFCLLIVVVVLGYSVTHPQPVKVNVEPVSLGSSEPISPNQALGSNITKTVTSTAVKLFAEASGAQLRGCTNTGSGDVTIGATSTNLTFGRGYVLRSSSSITWSGNSLYTGDIWVIGTSTVSCWQI